MCWCASCFVSKLLHWARLVDSLVGQPCGPLGLRALGLALAVGGNYRLGSRELQVDQVGQRSHSLYQRVLLEEDRHSAILRLLSWALSGVLIGGSKVSD